MKQIVLTQGKFSLIDDEDFERINKYKWYAAKGNNTFYAQRYDHEEGKLIKMHRYILNINGKNVVDHINGNGLDNQKSNIRICTNAQNSANRRVSKNSYSKYLGVCFEFNRGKWRARITTDKIKKHIGYFKTEENAATAYNIYAEKYHGEYANLNKL